MVLTNVGSYHPFDLVLVEPEAETEVFDTLKSVVNLKITAVVGNYSEISDILPVDRIDQILGNTADSEAANHDGCAVFYFGGCFIGGLNYLGEQGMISPENRSEGFRFGKKLFKHLRLNL
jgi:hypothetical protein